MSTTELKIDLINRISNTDDPGIIQELKKLLDFELDKAKYQLSSEQELRLKEAQNEYLSGSFLSEKQADETIEKWLDEK